MAADAPAWRLLCAAPLVLAAGALAATWPGSARAWSAGAALLLGALALVWPLARQRPTVPAPPPPVPAPDTLRWPLLSAQLDHLPVAVWSLHGGELRPLSHRARRFMAPGGLRDAATLPTLLRQSPAGAVLVDTERGPERWQLQRQGLAFNGSEQLLVALVPLENELEAENLQAWQQLVQVLTHEIMNSLTPVQSLSRSALALLDDTSAAGAQHTARDAELHLSLDTIARRAQSLGQFVASYRRVSQCPPPQFAPVDLAALWGRLQRAVAPGWQHRGGCAVFELAEPTLRLMADEGQLEQVLLNLIRNAEQATADLPAPRLWVQARQGRGGRLQITVRDNGPGVPAGLERQIFVPFFSAREGGQGIGLAVVRQLVHGMQGRVRHVRALEGGAAFVLSF